MPAAAAHPPIAERLPAMLGGSRREWQAVGRATTRDAERQIVRLARLHRVVATAAGYAPPIVEVLPWAWPKPADGPMPLARAAGAWAIAMPAAVPLAAVAVDDVLRLILVRGLLDCVRRCVQAVAGDEAAGLAAGMLWLCQLDLERITNSHGWAGRLTQVEAEVMRTWHRWEMPIKVPGDVDVKLADVPAAVRQRIEDLAG